MASLNFYDGAKPGKKINLSLNERSEKKKQYETKHSEKWQRNRNWLVFDKEKPVMTCTDCVSFYGTK